MKRDYTVIFDIAGCRKESDVVFITCRHRRRVYSSTITIYHRNDYHTVVRIKRSIMTVNFLYEADTGIYRNIHNITWDELRKIADVELYKV